MQDHFDFYSWERGALQELYREYRSLFFGKRLPMKPAAIALFDSETHWGRWDRLTRTISISKRLIQNHPWFQVLGILRHEMAHQWADESPGRGSSELPHGERFRLGCRVIGVPQEFCSAGIDLTKGVLDWRQEVRDETSEKLLDKVRKLLALATSSNEHEALLAMNKVRELYAKYNLEQDAQDSGAARSGFAHIVICHGKKRIEAHQDKIIGILVGHFFVKVLTFSQFDVVTGGDHRAIEIIGTRENALMAEYVYHFLLHQTEFWVGEATRGAKRGAPRLHRKSYRLGILEGFEEKLRRTETEKSATAAGGSPESPAVNSTELSLIGKAVERFRSDGRLDEYLSEIYTSIGSRSYSWQDIDGSAFHAGKAVGKSLTLNKAVTADQGNQGLLLSGKS